MGYLKSLWDMVAVVMHIFGDWHATVWDKINVDVLVEETRKLAKDVKTLNKAVRGYEVYRCAPAQLLSFCHFKTRFFTTRCMMRIFWIMCRTLLIVMLTEYLQYILRDHFRCTSFLTQRPLPATLISFCSRLNTAFAGLGSLGSWGH